MTLEPSSNIKLLLAGISPSWARKSPSIWKETPGEHVRKVDGGLEWAGTTSTSVPLTNALTSKSVSFRKSTSTGSLAFDPLEGTSTHEGPMLDRARNANKTNPMTRHLNLIR